VERFAYGFSLAHNISPKFRKNRGQLRAKTGIISPYMVTGAENKFSALSIPN
jgi:hypothetical protein